MGRKDFAHHFSTGKDSWEQAWEIFRWVICFPQMLLSLFLGLRSLTTTLIADEGDAASCNHNFLQQLLIIGTIAEVAMMSGHMWFARSSRSLPYWPVELNSNLSLRHLSRLFLKYPTLNNLLAAAFFGSLVLALPFPEIFLLPSVVFFWCLSAIDLWRLITYHQWLLTLTALLFTGPVASMQIHLYSLYFWAGLQKLVMKDFYENIAPLVFEPILNIADNTILLPLAIRSELIRKNIESIHTVICGTGVLFETALGLAFFIPQLLPTWVLNLALLFNFILHLYIITMIGYKNGILTFWCWNLLCMSISQIVFSPFQCLHETMNVTFESLPSAWHSFLILVFAIFPATVLIGKCPNGVLSHTYFAPGWFGHSFFLLPKRAEKNLPKHVNKIYFEIMSKEEHQEDFYYIIAVLIKRVRAGDITREQLTDALGLTEDSSQMGRKPSLEKLLEEQAIAIDGTWVDMTHNLGPTDPWKTYYSAGTDSWWKTVASDVTETSGIHLLISQFSIFGRFTSAKVIKP